jgi:uncharacterized coiled-coil protein SlyX
MTTEQRLDEANMKLLQASVDLIGMGHEIAELRKVIRLQKAQLTLLTLKLAKVNQFDGLAEVV